MRGLRAVSRRGAALAAAVLALGLATGAAASAGLGLAGRNAAYAATAQRTATVRSAVHTTFQRYADTIADLAAAGTGGATALDPLLARVTAERLPGAHQVLFVGPAHTVLVAHTIDGSAPAVPAVGPALARALELSRASGRTVATPAHVLPVDAGLPPAHRQPAFELAAPVPAEPFAGWIVVSVRAADLLDAALATAPLTGVAAVLAETTPDGATREIAHWPAAAAGHGTAERLDVALAGHAWQVLIRPTAAPAASAAVPLTASAGALTGLLAAAAVLAADAGRRRAVRDAADRQGDRDRAERAERALRDRDAELTGLAAIAGAHLHAPLHAVAGYTDLLLDEGPDATARDFLQRIGRSTQRMLGVVDELLAYAAASEAALRLEPVDIERLADDVVAAHRDAVAERPSIDVGELPLVTADGDLLRRVLDQLVGNAVRFVRHGTAARITITARELPDGWWRIEVADRGIGVPEEHRERIFAPFHRTPSAEGFPGTGLGLAVCRRIVALHGGRIGVEPNPGGGSLFWFTVSATGVTVPDALPELALG
ncbi:MAG TPA: HAMP domain-containing sensor histidine kinase [Actinoplanes sp.]